MRWIVAGIVALLAPAVAHAQQYRFPTTEAHWMHFYATAYKDHSGVDWGCGGIRYSNHRGSDFGGGGFAGMDEGRDIVAAADGMVITVNDGEYDRCITGDCAGGGGFGNYVRIEHADGKQTIYGHLKQWSVAVAAGDQVSCGQLLGQMGSSGYSTGPHIHFEVRAPDGVAHDPFWGDCSAPPSYWVDQGEYDALPAATCEREPLDPFGGDGDVRVASLDPAEPPGRDDALSGGCAGSGGGASWWMVLLILAVCGRGGGLEPAPLHAASPAPARSVEDQPEHDGHGYQADQDHPGSGRAVDACAVVGARRSGVIGALCALLRRIRHGLLLCV